MDEKRLEEIRKRALAVKSKYPGIRIHDSEFDKHAPRDIIDLLAALAAATERVAQLESAWAVDETVQPDGTLRPSIAATVARAEKAEHRAEIDEAALVVQLDAYRTLDAAMVALAEKAEADLKHTNRIIDMQLNSLTELRSHSARLEAALAAAGKYLKALYFDADPEFIKVFNQVDAALEGGA